MRSLKKQVMQMRANDMARGLDAASGALAKRSTLEEVPCEVAFEVVTKMAAQIRQLAIDRGENKTTSNDVAQGILWAVEDLRSKTSPGSCVLWIDLASDLSLRAIQLRAQALTF